MAADPYSILGVARSASEKEVKSAYRKLAKELHPDTNKDNPKATERFAEVTRAYDLLSDKDKRAKFDRGEIDADLHSRKGGELAVNPHVALLFHWKSLRRQVRIEGPAVAVTPAEADAYFASRHPESRLGSAASEQSRPLPSREVYLERVAALRAHYPEGDVPRPEHWSGYRVVPDAIEFWQDRDYRLHERRRFVADGAGGWTSTLLYP